MLSDFLNNLPLLKRYFKQSPAKGRARKKIIALYDEASINSRIKAAQERVNLEEAEMRDIVCQYIQDTPVMFENLEKAQRKGDCREILLYAHSIVGVAALLNIDEVVEYAHLVEEDAKNQRCSGADSFNLLFEHHYASHDALRRLFPCS
jgi:HPt (histidine-containing phosphotransfer) domain-containing protein